MTNTVNTDESNFIPDTDYKLPSYVIQTPNPENNILYVHELLKISKDTITILGEIGTITIDMRTGAVTFDGDVKMGEAAVKFFEGIAILRDMMMGKKDGL